MARRNKRQESYTSIFMKMGLAFTFLGVFWHTKSLQTTVIAVGLYGALCIGLYIAMQMKKKENLKRSGIAEIDTMDGIQFEYYLQQLYKSQGYKTEVTSASGDFGADLLLSKENKRIVVQAKRYSKNVGIDAVQQVVGSISHYKANEAWVITNRDFTAAAYKLAASNNVTLINRNAFIEMVLKMNPTAVPDPILVKKEVPHSHKNCKQCGQDMIVRKGKNGEFYGCSDFPKCRNTIPF